MEVYNDLMYLPRGPLKNSCSAALYDFVVSIANSVINPTTMLSNQKSTAHVNLLSTRCNYVISSGFHYSSLIRLVGWFYFNLFIHSCNTCWKSQKRTSCKSLNKYLSKYLCGVNFGFLFPFCTNSNSFVFNQFLPSLGSMV